MDNREMFSFMFGTYVVGEIILTVSPFLRLLLGCGFVALRRGMAWAWAWAVWAWIGVWRIWSFCAAHWMKAVTCMIIAFVGYAVTGTGGEGGGGGSSNTNVTEAVANNALNTTHAHQPLLPCVDRATGPAFQTVRIIIDDLIAFEPLVPALAVSSRRFGDDASRYLNERQAIFATGCIIKFSALPAYIAANSYGSTSSEDQARKMRFDIDDAVDLAEACAAAWTKLEGTQDNVRAEIGAAQATVAEEKARRAASGQTTSKAWAASLKTDADIDGALRTLAHAMQAAATFQAYAGSAPCMLETVKAVKATLHTSLRERTGPAKELALRELDEQVRTWEIRVAA